MASPPPKTRKTRFVCISDTHNASPHDGAFKLPAGDVLLHAGDLSNQGSLSELRKTVQWLEEADFEAKIVVAGNHDITLDKTFYQEHGLYFHNQHPQDPDACRALFEKSESVTYLEHEARVIRLTKASGPRTQFKIFGSPYSPKDGLWGFSYEREGATLWRDVPLDVDVVMTHTPPRYHLDSKPGKATVLGCEALRQALWRVRPRLAVCGHVHEGRGAEVVRWRLDLPFSPYLEVLQHPELETMPWEDPGAGNRKQSLVRLRGTDHGMILVNDGSRGTMLERNSVAFSHPAEVERTPAPFPLATDPAAPAAAQSKSKHIGGHLLGRLKSKTLRDLEERSAAQSHEVAEDEDLSRLDDYDVKPLAGRLGRKETCIINAAINAASFGHRKRFNKPIVVDIDLPVWDE